jgi:methionyl-tRNA formyltransferase
MLKVALAAEDAAGVRALRMLADRGHHVVAVFSGVGQERPGPTSVVGEAASLCIPTRPAAAVRGLGAATAMEHEVVDLLLSVHCRHAIHADLLGLPRVGAFNLHPGPLPERAGLHPPSWALYEGAAEHGVTLHHMTPSLDGGAIVFEERFPLRSSDTGLSVLTQCVRRGLGLLERLLDVVERGEPIPTHPQNLAERRWFGPKPPQHGRLDWSTSARRVVDFVRACDYRPFTSPWGFPRCTAHGVDLAIVKARVARAAGASAALPAPGTVRVTPTGSVRVAAGDGWVEVDEVGVAGAEFPADEVLTNGERLTRARDELRVTASR